MTDPLNDLLAAAQYNATLTPADALWAHNEIVRLRAALASALAELLGHEQESLNAMAPKPRLRVIAKPGMNGPSLTKCEPHDTSCYLGDGHYLPPMQEQLPSWTTADHEYGKPAFQS